MAENLTPKQYIDSSNIKQILTAIKNEIPTTVAELVQGVLFQYNIQVAQL